MVKDISLPPLNSALGLPPDNTPLPEGMNVVPESRAGSAGAFYFPVETEKGRRYVIVVLDSANTMSAVFRRQARQALVYTLAVLLAMTCLTAIVVWQFTLPIKSLSIAAPHVAGGQLSYSVAGTKRRGEMGGLRA